MFRKDTTNPKAHRSAKPVFTSESRAIDLGLLANLRFELTELSHAAVGPEWSSNGVAEGDYCHHIEFVCDGWAEVTHGRETMPLLPGHCYWLPGNTPVVRNCPQHYEVYYLRFEVQWIDGVDLLLDWPNRRFLDLGPWDQHEWVAQWKRKPLPISALLQLKGQLGIWLATHYPELDDILAQHVRAHNRFAGILRALESKLDATVRVEELAEVDGTSPQVFARAFAREFGLSPKAYLSRRLNEKICRMLVETDRPLKRISMEAGFEDECYFSRFFTKMNGVSPGAYRQRALTRLATPQLAARSPRLEQPMSLQEKFILLIVATAVIATLAMIPANPKSHASLDAGNVDWSKVVDNGQRLEISWMGIPSYPRAIDGSWIQRNLEARFNLTLEPIFMDMNGFTNRRPMMFCGGDIPDVIWDGDPLGVRNNLRNGFIMEVPWDVILRYAPTYVKLLNRYGREAWLYSHYDGHNFGIPTFNEGANRPRIGAWRMDWLHKVGIDQVPQTVMQMHEALYRMRYDDPDGDGKKDTYGWSPTIGHWSLAFEEIFAAYDVLPFDFVLHDGKVVWGGTLPGTQQALRTLRQWYQEDLLDPDFVLQTQEADTESRFLSGRVGYIYPVDAWSNYDLSDSGSLLSRLRALHPGSEMAPAPPLRDESGQRRGCAWGGAAHVMQFGRQVERDPQKVIRVLKMFEAITRDPQLYLEARCGKEGLHWRNDPGRGIVAAPPFDRDDRLRDQQMIAYSGFGSMFFYPNSLDETYDAAYADPRSVAYDNAYRRPEWGITNVLGKSDVVPSAARYLDDLRKFQMTIFVEMVTGRRPVDDFDQFAAEFNHRGGDVIVREANQMYAQLQKIYTQVGAESSPHAQSLPETQP